jgi:HPt (histidine-containing phosphotransfer) domain-containing protein
MDDYLAKPVKSERLFAVVAQWAGQHHPMGAGGFREPELVLTDALAVLENDRELVAELTRELAASWPQSRAVLRRTAAEGDLAGLGDEAHRLRGALCYFGQSGTVELARRLEVAAQEERPSAASQLSTQLEREVEHLIASLTAALDVELKAKGREAQ